MTLSDATDILYGPVPTHEVVIVDPVKREATYQYLTSRDLETLLTTETRPCAIYVDGLLVRRVGR